MASTEAQKKASREYEKRNKEKTRIQGYKRTARSFIKNHATLEDLEEFEMLIKAKREELGGK